ncbi:RNA methyltransferase [Candidatus Parcubacteria bacterium]|jgi:RNA methyltransferase, TrmH family|nr:RNA methyltransferase [Candidatus Parcubacteria bacterium]MBT3948518.1 RNA methyltransferase [Candidatus Parcubacteria bacterium]
MLSQKIQKHLKQLQQKKFRKEFEEFIVEGVKGVEEGLNSDADVALLVVEGNRRDENDIAELITLAEKSEIPVEFCGRKDVDDIKTTDTFPGVLAVIGQEQLDLEDVVEGPIICLDEVKDPGNLGTIIRTADWFGIKNIVLSEKCVDVYNPKVVRSTMGSIFHVNILRSENISKTLERLKKEFEYEVNALDMEGKDITKLKPKNKAVYLFGSESHGVSDALEELIDNRYTISGSGDAESLNLAISAGILMSRLSS